MHLISSIAESALTLAIYLDSMAHVLRFQSLYFGYSMALWETLNRMKEYVSRVCDRPRSIAFKTILKMKSIRKWRAEVWQTIHFASPFRLSAALVM